MEENKFLGEGKLSRLMLKFSLPCILSLMVSALYNIVDQIFIGQSELSTLGNAASGVVFPIFIIAQAFAWCFGDGCAAYLNICQGRKDSQSAHKAIGTGILVTILSSAVLLALFYPLKRQLLTLFGASENSIGMAIDYFNIVLAFFPLYMLSNMLNAVIRSDGSPAWSMASMLAGAIINIILDPVFIFVCKWGMQGAAWATVIGQTVSFLISLVYMFRTKTFKLTLKSFIPDFKSFSGAFKLGLSSFITQITIVIISLVCNVMFVKYGMQSKYGADIPIAVIGIESKVFTIVINMVVGIVLGCQPIISYNMGAKKYDRLRKLYRDILLCTVVIGVVFTVLFEAAPRAVVSIFGKPTNIPNPDDYWEFAEKVFRIFLMLVTFTCVVKMSSIFFQAVGKPIQAITSSLVRDLVLFVPLICILPIYYGVEGILFAAPIADAASMTLSVILIILFFKGIKKEETKERKQEDGALKPSRKGPIITIAREHGSGGKQIGRLVAQALDIPFYYKEMTALAAQESGLSKEFISDMNKSAPSVLYSLYMSTEVVQQAVVAQEKIIKKIAENGSCVIVGRAADFVLRDNPNVVKIFIQATDEFKIKRLKETYGDTEEEARKNCKRSDAARAKYYNAISGQTWGKRENYDLVIDAEKGIEESAEAITAYVRKKFPRE